MSKCNTCREEMVPMFTGEFCKNHCDLPQDKRIVARAKDEEGKKNVNVNRNPSSAGNGNSSVPATPPSPNITYGGRTTCPVCGAAASSYAIRIGNQYHCGYYTIPPGGIIKGCPGKWSVSPGLTPPTSPAYPGIGGITINLGYDGNTIRIIPDHPVRENYAIVYRGHKPP